MNPDSSRIIILQTKKRKFKKQPGFTVVKNEIVSGVMTISQAATKKGDVREVKQYQNEVYQTK